MKIHHARSAAVMLALMLAVTGCGPTADSRSAAAESRAADPDTVFEDGPSSTARPSTSSAAPTPTATPKPTPSVLSRPHASLNETFPLADSAGYTANLTVRFRLDETWDKSIVNDRPGLSTATMTAPLTASATNTTPGRTAPGVFAVEVKGLYPIGSRPCEVDEYEARYEKRTKDEQFCIVTIAHASRGTAPFTSGATVSLQPSFNDESNGVLTMHNVPEESFAQVTKGMSNPVGLFVQPLFWESGPIKCVIDTNKKLANGVKVIHKAVAITPGLPCA